MSEALPPVEDGFGPFFDVRTNRDLAEALGDHQRAPQARWPAMAVVLVLRYWAFMNRRLPFSQLLYRSWHLVLAFAEKGAARWPPGRSRPKL